MSTMGGKVQSRTDNITGETTIMCKLCPLEAREMAGGPQVKVEGLPHRVFYNNEELYTHLMFHQKKSLAEMLAVYMFEDKNLS